LWAESGVDQTLRGGADVHHDPDTSLLSLVPADMRAEAAGIAEAVGAARKSIEPVVDRAADVLERCDEIEKALQDGVDDLGLDVKDRDAFGAVAMRLTGGLDVNGALHEIEGLVGPLL
jgi:hypothetical protein